MVVGVPRCWNGSPARVSAALVDFRRGGRTTLGASQLPRRLEPPSTSVRVGDADVQVSKHLKYLGLTLDGRWGFEEHFERLVPRIQKVAGAMHGLLPNLGGPQEGVRRLYAEVVRSIALYGSPVWSKRLSSVQRLRTKLNSVQRKMAIRVARGYRTISFEAATVLARCPPFDILADMDARIYAERNLRIDLASNPVKFGDDRSNPIFELSNCQIQLLFTMMIFYCWVNMGVDNDLHPLEKRIEDNEYGDK
ncbi:jg6499 [Pararge aegeria aegeria]|uniref:Jg6499 protein n=1 Tax=Pararge aegeria aegeria TaxID=348720 RepID=A0A8S4SJN5_9NEOP|nr:jg6499 [Pararge aegeria aegeria]